MIRDKLGIKSFSEGVHDDSVSCIPDKLQNGALRNRWAIDPDMTNEITCYILDREGPGPYPDRIFLELRRGLFSSLTLIDMDGAGSVALLSEDASRFVGERIAEIQRDDELELLLVEGDLAPAMATVNREGNLVAGAGEALAAWDRAVGAIESFLSEPRHACLIDLEDLLEGARAPYVLAEMLELCRRLLLAAGKATDNLGAATVGRFDFEGLEDAVAMWRISEADTARCLCRLLSELASRTAGFGAVPEMTDPLLGDASWIAACSRLGQEVMEWVLARRPVRLEFSGVGRTWPGPALYGRDSGEEEPRMASLLLSALALGDRGTHGMLFGSYSVGVDDVLAIEVPEAFSEGERTVYASTRHDENGSYLSCRAERRHFGHLAGLISDEQRLEDYSWSHVWSSLPSDEVPDDLLADFDRDFHLEAIDSTPIEIDGSGRMSLSGLRVDGLARGSVLTLSGDADRFIVSEKEREEKRLAMYEADLRASIFEEIRP